MKKIAALFSIGAAAGVDVGEIIDRHLPPARPPKVQTAEDLERIEKAKSKRERKAKRGW